ncbi:MAG: hypothetical protein ACP5H2_01990 [Solirubrobacteraceae bacterium]
MRRPAYRLAIALLSAGTLAGCGITNPYASTSAAAPGRTRPARTSSTSATTFTDADPTPERGGTIPRPAARAGKVLAAGAGQPTPRLALEHYARIYINWRASTVAQTQRRLAGISLAGARAQALQAAASYQHDATLARSQVANSGQVVSIAPGQGPAAGVWVIVTSEKTTGQGDYQGLPAQLHVTYAQLTHTPGGWVVSEWEPRT